MTRVVVDVRLADPALDTAVRAAAWADAGLEVVDATDLSTASAAAVLVVTDRPLSDADLAQVDALAGDRPLLLVGPTLATAGAGALATRVGLRLGPPSPEHEVRVRPSAVLRDRGAVESEWLDRVAPVDDVADDVVVGATANVAYTDHPVAAYRPSTRTGALTLGTTQAAWASRDLLRLLHRWIRSIVGTARPAAVRIGMLGYGAIGHEHAHATVDVPGLELVAVADLSPARVAAARAMVPSVRGVDSAESLLDADDVDLVVVSTPPNTHAQWALRALDAGKHVVLEKPMALRAKDCDAVMERADEVGRVALVYQNRRFDPDYRVLRRLVTDGSLGRVFHLESFVGGYGHPCNYWHSDAEVSGGALFDWGSHVLDQVLDLLPGGIEHVTAAAHKRVWHDVTNADHSRVTVRFRDGVEAEFVHSDLAAAVKPKWYVLGTGGAVVGSWRQERVVGRGPVGTLQEDVLALADSPADLHLHHPDGSVTALAVPYGRPHPFHRDLADHLLEGMPMRVRAEQSRRVVAVLEAAAESAAAGARPVVPS